MPRNADAFAPALCRSRKDERGLVEARIGDRGEGDDRGEQRE